MELTIKNTLGIKDATLEIPEGGIVEVGLGITLAGRLPLPCALRRCYP